MGNKVGRIAGGSASRAEVYGLFFAAIVLIGGGIGGAVAATGGFSQVAAPVVTETAVATTTAAEPVSTPTVTSSPVSSTPPVQQQAPAATPVQLPKATTPPLSETFEMPNIVGTSYRVSSDYLLNTIGHRGGFTTSGGCFGLAPFEIKEQSPAPGVIVNKNQAITVLFQSGMIPCVP